MERERKTRRGANTAMLRGLFRTKPLDTILDDTERPEFQLRRVLGPLQLTLLGIGAIIGAGIFATIGTAAAGDQFRPGAGPALMVSFVITAIVCSFTALCYAEFASMVPISGSAYTYSYATLGELLAWIIGWDLIIEYAVGNIAVAISWANYFKTFMRGFGIVIPDWLSMDYRTAAKIPGVYESAPHVFGVPDHLQPAGRRDRRRDHDRVDLGHPRERAAQRGDGGDQDRRPDVLHRRRTLLGAAGQLDAVCAQPLGGDECRRGHRVLRVHRLRRHHHRGRGDVRTRSATCPSASSPRCSSARSSTSSWRQCSPD